MLYVQFLYRIHRKIILNASSLQVLILFIINQVKYKKKTNSLLTKMNMNMKIILYNSLLSFLPKKLFDPATF